MFLVGSHITIGEFEFTACVDCEITTDVDTLTDTCRITLPRKYEWQLKNIALGDDPLIKRKDPVLVRFGYDGELVTEFIGFVKDIKSGTPVVIECEDSMMLLKQSPVKVAFRAGTSLRSLLTAILPKEIEFVCIDTVVGDWRINNATPAAVLEELKSKKGFSSYFRLIGSGDNVRAVLYVGWQYWVEERKQETFAFGKSWQAGKGLIINANDLVYKRSEDIRLKLKVVSIGADNKKTEYEFGDADGEVRTVHYNKADKATVKARAEEDLQRFKHTGYRGSFLTFGQPSVQKGDIVAITGNEYYPDGKYLVSKVTKQLGVSTGIKQTIFPGKIVNNVTSDT